MNELPDLVLPDDDDLLDALKAIPAALSGYGYNEVNIRELLGVGDPGQLLSDNIPGYLWRCQKANSVLALLVAFFLLHQPVRRASLEEYLGEEEVAALIAAGVVVDDGEAVRSTVDLYPIFGRYVFTDPVLARQQFEGHVYELGADSYAIARVTPRKRVLRTLDLCTGSGVHAILGGGHSEQVVGVDINPRALAYSRLNAHMNGVAATCSFVEGDLFAPVPRAQYDLITVNPPFVPSPDRKVAIHRSPGETGEEVSSRLVAALPEYLAVGGLFSMVLDYPVMRDSTYLERLGEWLGESHGWGIAILDFGVVPNEKYILGHLDFNVGWSNFQETFQQYLESYERLGITSVGFANVFIKRLTDHTPTWGHRFSTRVPSVFLCDRVEEWLDGLEDYGNPDWDPDWEFWKPRLSHHYSTLWRDSKKKRGLLESSDLNWCQPLALDRLQAMLADRLNGKRTGEELVQGWAKSRRLEPEAARREVTEILRFLGCQGALS